ncbi:hypothetical protein FH972_020040 [Carpinus fangiana]|uniref:EGF-like domain-containing protein n=1 Tax=Carpinus fangiana TaxID=176857 RepID=A0A5N6RTJ7_9ROSI|nr:hypothetical protein FH972_020040 [Carpinus fangiana]
MPPPISHGQIYVFFGFHPAFPPASPFQNPTSNNVFSVIQGRSLSCPAHRFLPHHCQRPLAAALYRHPSTCSSMLLTIIVQISDTSQPNGHRLSDSVQRHQAVNHRSTTITSQRTHLISTIWQSGPWNSRTFTGVPDMNSVYLDGFSLVDDEERTFYLTFSFLNESYLVNFVLNEQGNRQQSESNIGEDWEVGWSALKNECDVYGKCGAFGSCNSQNTPICSCLPGFEPKNTEEWNRGNWTSGCVGGHRCSVRGPITAQLLNSGNLVLQGNTTGTFLWDSFQHPFDTLMENMKISTNVTSAQPNTINHAISDCTAASETEKGKKTYSSNSHSSQRNRERKGDT